VFKTDDGDGAVVASVCKTHTDEGFIMPPHLLLRSRSFASAIAITLAPLVFVFTGTSQAAFVDCPASFTQNGTAKVHDGAGAPVLTAANDCEYITPPDQSNVANETNINANGGFFGFNDWDIWDAAVSQVGANASSGTWAIPSVDFATYDYMITFKDGSATNLISFKLNELYASGGWNTPFTDPPFSLPGMSPSHDVSHYSISRRETDGTTDVPEPGTMVLLGLGFLGLGYIARRSAR
jgi:hypothetical protein